MSAEGLRLGDIRIRDPFLLPVPEEGATYLLGTTDPDPWHGPGVGFDAYRSTDLERWKGPIPAFRPPAGFWADRNFWAPEVHRYRGGWYLLATFTAVDGRRGTQVLVADRPAGPYAPWSDGPVTPAGWTCLDGTLHVDDVGDPWLLFCREWLEVGDGEIHAQRLTPDLAAATGEPVLLLRASEAPWTRPIAHPDAPGGAGSVTDGPFVRRLAAGGLALLWSSMGERGYAMGVATAPTGDPRGPWRHEAEPLWADDGGHGMIATTLAGEQVVVLHRPNTTPDERAVLLPVTEAGRRLQVVR